MRANEYTWQEVADRLGFRSRGAAQLAVRRYLARTAPDSPDLSRRYLVEAAKSDARVLREGFEAAAARGDDDRVVAYAGARVKNRDQLAKLAGAYAPARAEVSHDVAGLTGPALAEAIRTRALELLPTTAINARPDAEVIDAELVAAPAPTPTEETAR